MEKMELIYNGLKRAKKSHLKSKNTQKLFFIYES